MSQTVADQLVSTLEQIGVRHIFGLIGDSLNPLADAVRRSKIEWVGVRHEEGGALAAAGQAKLTGRLGVCAGTTGPGSTHLVAGLYEASRDHAPVLALSGDMPRKMQGTDYIQTTDTDLLFRDVSLYTETVSSPAQAPAAIHQAIAAAYAGRGVAHLTLPQDVINAKADGSVSSIATLKPRSEIVASDADIAEIARRIDDASSVVVMCGAGLSRCRRRTACAVRSAQGALDPLGQGQGYYVLRRAALDGRHRHDRLQGGVQRHHALRALADAGHRLSLFRIPAAQDHRHSGRRPRSASSVRCAQPSNCCSTGSKPRAMPNSSIA
jgi:thiamine pyrophosphate-dependent acetolactate synthase large subunit-like protein